MSETDSDETSYSGTSTSYDEDNDLTFTDEEYTDEESSVDDEAYGNWFSHAQFDVGANKGSEAPNSNEIQLDLVSDIAQMNEQLQAATQRAQNLLGNLKPKTNIGGVDDDSSVQTTRSVMSVDAIAKLKKKLLPTESTQTYTMHRSASTPQLPRRFVDIFQTESAQVENTATCIPEDPVVKPHDCFLSLLESEAGIKGAKARKASSLDGFFLEWTKENIAAYESDLVTAIKSNDLDTVRRLHGLGRKLLCCNRFGESVVHMICRHGRAELLQYFMVEADVPIRLQDEQGRTPLHDACWSSKPNFDCVKLVLEECPDMLLISDNRGFTPLAYVPRNAWDEWCSFLENNAQLLVPKEFSY